MARLVRPKQAGAAQLTAGGDPLTEAQEKIAKYVPTEVITLYFAGSGFIETSSNAQLRLCLYIALLVIFLGITVYLINRAASKDPQQTTQSKRTNLMMAIFAYLVWTYSIGGAYKELHLYIPPIPAFLMIVFFGACLCVTPPPTPAPQASLVSSVPPPAATTPTSPTP